MSDWERDITLEASDGPRLEARLGVHEAARGGLVACHPHPLYGGDMENPVVVRAVEVAREVGLSTLRFNFRGVGRSTGIHAKGEGEQGDLKAALAMLHSHLPPDRPLGVAGYSFGAWVAAGVAGSGSERTALCLIAPPLAMLDFATLDRTGERVLLVAGTRDSYCPLESLEALGGRLPGAQLRIVDGADHFFFGKLFPLGEAIRSWARDWAID
jgi:uncharacterized protein